MLLFSKRWSYTKGFSIVSQRLKSNCIQRYMIEILRFRISYNFTSCPVNKGYQNPLIYEHNMFLLSKNFFLCMCGLCCNHVWEYHRDTQRTHASTTCSFCSSVTVRFSNGKVISATLRFYFSKKNKCYIIILK